MWLVWIPAHVGIEGNEAADQLAKKAISFDQVSQPIPLSIQEAKPIIQNHLVSNWQLLWDTGTTADLYRQIVPTVSLNIKFSDPNRHLESTISKLRFNHNDLQANKYKIHGSDSPLCPTCHTEEDINHYLFDCMRYIDLQLDNYIAFSERDIPYTLPNMLGEHRVGTILTYEYILKTKRFSRLENV